MVRDCEFTGAGSASTVQQLLAWSTESVNPNADSDVLVDNCVFSGGWTHITPVITTGRGPSTERIQNSRFTGNVGPSVVTWRTKDLFIAGSVWQSAVSTDSGATGVGAIAVVEIDADSFVFDGNSIKDGAGNGLRVQRTVGGVVSNSKIANMSPWVGGGAFKPGLLDISAVSGTYTAFETITASPSGATGRVLRHPAGANTLLTYEVIAGAILDTDTIDGGTSSASATVDLVIEGFNAQGGVGIVVGTNVRDLTIEGCTVQSNSSYGIALDQLHGTQNPSLTSYLSSPRITNSLVANNGDTGIYIHNGVQGTVLIEGNTIRDNTGEGIFSERDDDDIYGALDNLKVINNDFTALTGSDQVYGVRKNYNFGAIDISHNTFDAAGTADVDVGTPEELVLSHNIFNSSSTVNFTPSGDSVTAYGNRNFKTRANGGAMGTFGTWANASGRVTVTHNLYALPTHFSVDVRNSVSGTELIAVPVSQTGSTVTFQVADAATGAVVSAGHSFAYGWTATTAVAP